MSPILALLVGVAALSLIAYILFRPRVGPGEDAEPGEPLGRRGRSSTGRSGPPRGGPVPGRCALCGSVLGPGERIKSDLGPGEGERLMRIFGCPRCWPAVEGKEPRACPVCGSGLGPEDFAVARYFERPGRKHVHVLGCARCRGARKG